MAKRINQGGSVLIYVIVAILLTATLIGSVYLVRNRGEQARSDTTTSKNKDDKKPTESTPKPEPAADDQAATGGNVDTGSPTEVDNPSDDQQAQVSDMPTTGIETDFVTYVTLFIATFLITKYHIERRQIN